MALTGKDGSVMLGANRVAEMKSWSLDLGADDIDVSNFDSAGWKEFLSGLKEWSGSFEGNFAPDDTTGQRALLTAWLNGEALTATFKVSEAITFTGKILVKPSIETPVDGEVTFSVDAQGTGPLTLPS